MPCPPACARAADEDVVGRLWRKDGTLWAPEGTPEVTNRLGWLDIAERSREQLAELRRAARRAAGRGLHRRGRARHGRLEPRARGLPPVVRQAQERGLRLHVLDSTHPDEVRKFLDSLDLDKTPDDRLLEVRRDDRADVDVQGVLARACDGTHFVAVTDPGTSLEELAGKQRLPARRSTATRTSAAATAR